MEEKLNSAYSKLDELLEVHKYYPMTTNSHFINNSKKPWRDASKTTSESMMNSGLIHSGQNAGIDELTRMLSTISAKADFDIDIIAAEEAFDNMKAYYEVRSDASTKTTPSPLN